MTQPRPVFLSMKAADVEFDLSLPHLNRTTCTFRELVHDQVFINEVLQHLRRIDAERKGGLGIDLRDRTPEEFHKSFVVNVSTPGQNWPDNPATLESMGAFRSSVKVVVHPRDMDIRW